MRSNITYRLIRWIFSPVNPIVRRILRSRFHWLLSRYVIGLEFTGVKSGRQYFVPVSYSQRDDGEVSVMTYRRRNWWRNLRGGRPLHVWLRGERLPARATVVEDDYEEIERGLAGRGLARRASVKAGADESVLIRIQPGAEQAVD